MQLYVKIANNMCKHHSTYGAALYLPGLKSGVSRGF